MKQQLGNWNKKIEALDHDIAIALRMGAADKEKLQKDLEHAKHDIGRLDKQLVLAIKEHSALFSSRFIAADLLAPLLVRAFNNLQEQTARSGENPEYNNPCAARQTLCGSLYLW